MSQHADNQKVFGVGLNKTGTSTLGVCGTLLGYRLKGCDRCLLEDVMVRNDFTRIEEVAGRFDLFEDWPWPLIYQQLDVMFPGSKFILTVRKDEFAWLDSLKKHSMRTHPVRNCRRLAYGYHYPHGHEQEHLAFYRHHNDAVRSYFKGRESDFIEVCWENGDAWNELCAFLGKDIPNVAFPHVNRGSDKWPGMKRFLVNRVSSVLYAMRG